MVRLGAREPGRAVPAMAAGFTLLELIIVLVLVGMFLVVSVPALRHTLIDDPLGATGRRLIGFLDGVRDRAVREDQGYMIYVDLDGNRMWQLREEQIGDEDSLPLEEQLLKPAADVRLRDIWRKNTGAVSQGIQEIWVGRRGYMEQTVFHLEDGDGGALSLLVFPFLPGVEVREGYYEPEQDEPFER